VRGSGRLVGPARLASLAGILALLSGCGGGLPLLHPARTLPQGDVRAEAGFSGNIAVGDLANAVTAAQAEQVPNGVPPTDPTYVKGALVLASVAPGLAPIGGARVGLGWQSEGGIVYTGRAIRFDVRRSFVLGDGWDLSLGVGGSSVLYGHQTDGVLSNVSLDQIHGWGADVPLLVGYQSAGDLYALWVGARGGWEQVDISDETSEPKSVTLGSPPTNLSATRFWGGGLLGFAIGFRHVHVAMELDAAYQTIQGSYNGTTGVTVSGLTLSPATALWWDF
jgi:hypothetical protein